MHYYQWHIGDYRRDTSHLTMLEHGAYRQLLDSYYLSESPLPSDECALMRSHCARTADEMQAIRNVLKDFFTLTENGWVHSRCDKDIQAIYSKSESARASANARWEKENSKRNANAMRTQCDGNATHIPNNPLPNNPDYVSNDTSSAVDDKPSPAKAKQTKPKSFFDYSTGRIENLSDEIVSSWQDAYPAIDIRAEIAKAKSWLLANPKNRKSNIEKFLTNWLNRAQDRAPRANYENGRRPGQREDTSAAGRVRAAIERERAAERANAMALGPDGVNVRTQVGEQLRGGGGPGQGLGSVLEGDYSRSD